MMVKGGIRATSVGNGKTVIVDRKQSSRIAQKYGDSVAKAVQQAAEKGKALNKTALVALLTAKGSKLDLEKAREEADKIISNAQKPSGLVGNPLKAKSNKMQEVVQTAMLNKKELSQLEVAKILMAHPGNSDKEIDGMTRKWLSSEKFVRMEIPLSAVGVLATPSEKPATKGPIIIEENVNSLGRFEGNYGAAPNAIVIDGKHRVAEAKRNGTQTMEAFVGDKVAKNLEKKIQEYKTNLAERTQALEHFLAKPESSTLMEVMEVFDRQKLYYDYEKRIKPALLGLREGGTISEDIAKDYPEFRKLFLNKPDKIQASANISTSLQPDLEDKLIDDNVSRIKETKQSEPLKTQKKLDDEFKGMASVLDLIKKNFIQEKELTVQEMSLTDKEQGEQIRKKRLILMDESRSLIAERQALVAELVEKMLANEELAATDMNNLKNLAKQPSSKDEPLKGLIAAHKVGCQSEQRRAVAKLEKLTKLHKSVLSYTEKDEIKKQLHLAVDWGLAGGGFEKRVQVAIENMFKAYGKIFNY